VIRVLLALLLRILAPIVRAAKEHRRTQFAALAQSKADLLFVGDSITEGGIWNEWFPTRVTANRGIGGDVSAEVLARMDALTATAKVVYLLIGTNDLTMRVKEDEIVETVRAILLGLRAKYPEARIVIQSVMPRKANFRERLRALNVRYVALADELGIEYLDLWPALGTSDGLLMKELSLDALHLNGEGYRRWVQVLEQDLAANS
jgi:lysophospholipase L1-like esterase